MRLLLTSAGVRNASIPRALVDLLGKPIADSSALCIPTAQYGHPMVGPGTGAWQFISGNSGNPMVDLGWKSVGVLELTALPSIDEERWVPLVREADVRLVAGGDANRRFIPPGGCARRRSEISRVPAQVPAAQAFCCCGCRPRGTRARCCLLPGCPTCDRQS